MIKHVCKVLLQVNIMVIFCCTNSFMLISFPEFKMRIEELKENARL